MLVSPAVPASRLSRGALIFPTPSVQEYDASTWTNSLSETYSRRTISNPSEALTALLSRLSPPPRPTTIITLHYSNTQYFDSFTTMARLYPIPGLLHALVIGYLPALVHGRTFTVTNSCPFTIWPAMFTDLSAGTAVPNFPTGWVAPPSNSVSFSVPDNWKAGRIWGRRDCDFTITTGATCLDGWCNGGLLCDPTTGTGVPPATVAEWTLQGDGNRDFYDVSLVDGYNLPMAITNSANCPVADCPVDLGPNCPAPIKGPFDSTGFPVGCKSACAANLDGNPTDSANCCSGSHSTAATCPASGVQYYDYFKGNCPNSYAYAYDESSNTALWTCDSEKNADYTLTFCPTGGSSDVASGSATPVASSTSSSATPPSSGMLSSGTPLSSTATVVGGPSSGTPRSAAPAEGSSASITGTARPSGAKDDKLEPQIWFLLVTGLSLVISMWA